MLLKTLFLSIILSSIASGLSAPAEDHNITLASKATNIHPVSVPTSKGGIEQLCVNGPFDLGSTFCDITLVPASEVLSGTPFAVVNSLVTPNVYTEFRLYYLSKTLVLSELIWTPATNIRFGANCADCLTQYGFQVEPSSVQSLYAMINPSSLTSYVRVGFISPGSPNTISEAILNKNTNKWTLSTLL
ncbi:hypothetical protein D9758_012126 [Tetrapyrgos nigripes]|uniref:Uncharacterized protein n=1 Tax=Tetrapyrgos nigripes TaxID=182062 RepID=A0A8H5CN54_9AGAR|nr:hypothetical protein D9758_012126 [Tetrapyrgos nigripes]